MNQIAENFENMNRKTKIILSIVGVSAVVVPALLLMLVTSSTKKEPDVATSKRVVDPNNIERSKIAPTPSPAPANSSTSSAAPKQGTGSAK